MAEPNIVTVRTLLAHFRSTLQTARQTSEPVTPAPAAAPTGAGAGVIALRHRTPAGVLLGYETWQADQAELAATRQRIAELEAQLARPQPSAEVGATWSVTPASAAPASSPATGLSWGSTGRHRGKHRQPYPGGASRERRRREQLTDAKYAIR